jgi:hypothetical protein
MSSSRFGASSHTAGHLDGHTLSPLAPRLVELGANAPRDRAERVGTAFASEARLEPLEKLAPHRLRATALLETTTAVTAARDRAVGVGAARQRFGRIARERGKCAPLGSLPRRPRRERLGWRGSSRSRPHFHTAPRLRRRPASPRLVRAPRGGARRRDKYAKSKRAFTTCRYRHLHEITSTWFIAHCDRAYFDAALREEIDSVNTPNMKTWRKARTARSTNALLLS